ncbi:MAG: acyltransferase family protein [Clostridia bacterium]|nr:acyltransferase family protein [Clostridia bacterium]
MAEVKDRIQKWDILKFVLIFFVVLGHVAEQYEGTSGLFFFIYSFHMPLFIFVSGLFSKRTINEKRYDKIFTYFVLYIFIKIIMCVSNYVNKGVIVFKLFEENGVPWYAFVIFAFCLITVFLKNLDPKYVFAFSVILACFAGYDSTLSSFLVSSRMVVFYPFFYAGYVLDPNTVAERLNKKPIKIASVAGIFGYIILLCLQYDSIRFLKPLLSGKNSFWTLEKLCGYGIFFRFGYYVLVFLLGAMIISLIPNRLGKGTIAKLGSRSVQVYALHYFFIHLLYANLNIDEWLESILPGSSKALILPLTIIILLLCSSKIWTPVFDFILKPKFKHK